MREKQVMKSKYLIHNSETLQAAIKQIRLDHKAQEIKINSQLKHFKDNKWNVIWTSLNPLKNNLEGETKMSNFQDYILPFIMGMRSMSSSPLTKVVIKIAELFIAKYLVRESGGLIESIVEKYRNRKKRKPNIIKD